MNATKRPSALNTGPPLMPFPCVPSSAMLMRDVTPVCRSCTNTSETPLVSPATRFDASEPNAT